MRSCRLPFFYLRDRYGNLWRVHALTARCNVWMPDMHLWMKGDTYHDLSEGFAPLYPCYDVLSDEQMEAWQ